MEHRIYLTVRVLSAAYLLCRMFHLLSEKRVRNFWNFLTAQAENEALIEKLIRENIDSDGTVLPENRRKQRWDVEEFDMDKYV